MGTRSGLVVLLCLILAGCLAKAPPQAEPRELIIAGAEGQRVDPAWEVASVEYLFTWGDLGEQYARALRKGDFVKARGRYHEEHWTDEQGQVRRTHKVTATFVRQLRARAVVREPEATYGQLMLAWLEEEEIPLPLPG